MRSASRNIYPLTSLPERGKKTRRVVTHEAESVWACNATEVCAVALEEPSFAAGTAASVQVKYRTRDGTSKLCVSKSGIIEVRTTLRVSFEDQDLADAFEAAYERFKESNNRDEYQSFWLTLTLPTGSGLAADGFGRRAFALNGLSNYLAPLPYCVRGSQLCARCSPLTPPAAPS